jgi:hypothetical protein
MPQGDREPENAPEKGSHPRGLIRLNFRGLVPKGVPVHIGDREVQKNLYVSRPSGFLHYLPIEMQAVSAIRVSRLLMTYLIL